jgi:hypothetical protein
MKFLVAVLIVALVAEFSNSLTVYDRDELMQLKEALRSQLDEIEAQERVDVPSQLPAEVNVTANDAPISSSETSACAACTGGSFCCRNNDEIQCCAKISRVVYKTGSTTSYQHVEIDRGDNSATFYLDDGEVGIIDFDKSVATLYIPAAKACYLIGGIGVRQAHELLDRLENGPSEHHGNAIHYKPLTATTDDHSIVHEDLQEKCKTLPVYWTEKSNPVDAVSVPEVKRCGSGRVCIGWDFFGACVTWEYC